MHPLRKQRLQLVILLVVTAALVIGLVVYMLRENGNFFYTPAQIISGEAPQSTFLRAGVPSRAMTFTTGILHGRAYFRVCFAVGRGRNGLTVS